MGLGGRLHLDWISSAEAHKFVRVVTGFTEKVRALGPSPLTGKLELNAIARDCEAAQEALSVEGGSYANAG